MAIEVPPLPDVAALLAPQEIEKKRRSSNRRTTAIVIGTILILSDGSECVVAAFDTQGNPLCYPVQK